MGKLYYIYYVVVGNADLQMVNITVRALIRPVKEKLPKIYKELGEGHNALDFCRFPLLLHSAPRLHRTMPPLTIAIILAIILAITIPTVP